MVWAAFSITFIYEWKIYLILQIDKNSLKLVIVN